MTMSDGMQTPFWRGFRTATLYYCAAIIVFVLLRVILPLLHDAFIYFLFLPVVLMVGIIWAFVCLIASFFRVRPRGTLVVHAIVIVLAFLLFMQPLMKLYVKQTRQSQKSYVELVGPVSYRDSVISVQVLNYLKI